VPQRRPVWADRPKWLLGQANSIGPQAEMPVEHCAAIFLFLVFFLISRNSDKHLKFVEKAIRLKKI
jgi:hypothetical protein